MFMYMGRRFIGGSVVGSLYIMHLVWVCVHIFTASALSVIQHGLREVRAIQHGT